jgi:tyrosinase
MRTRENVKYLSAPEKTAFVNAVLALKAKPSVLHPGDTNMGRYDDYVELHMSAMMASPGWAHNRSAFFPWHRELVLQFENDLVSIDPSVTVPYWDWPDAASSPFTAGLLGGDGALDATMKVQDGSAFASNGPAHWTVKVKDNLGDPDYLRRGFGRRMDAMNLPTASDVTTSLAVTPYDSSPWANWSAGFRSQTEGALHNLVHRWVNGSMYDMTSPNDPVFWLHHCNIDRLWAMWQYQHPSASFYLPVSGASLGHNLMDAMIFSGGGPAPWVGSATPADVINHHALGYRYDTDPIEIPKVDIPRAFVSILFGVTNCGPGVVIGPDGKPHRVPGGPGDPEPTWLHLSHAQREVLASLAIRDLGNLLPKGQLREGLTKLSAETLAKGTKAEAPTR